MVRLMGVAAVAAVLAAPGSAPAAYFVYAANLDGPSEAPPNASPGTGFALLYIDTTAHTFRIDYDFTGLTGTLSAAHIHGPTALPGTGTAGVMTATPTFPGTPVGVTAGSYDMTFDMTMASSWNAAFVTANGGTPAGAEAAFIAAVADGKAYLNLHTSTFGGGEVRGFFTPFAAPEPSSLALVGVGAAGLAVRLRRRLRA